MPTRREQAPRGDVVPPPPGHLYTDAELGGWVQFTSIFDTVTDEEEAVLEQLEAEALARGGDPTTTTPVIPRCDDLPNGGPRPTLARMRTYMFADVVPPINEHLPVAPPRYRDD